MKHADLDRVQHDLDLIKSALSSEFPYDRRHFVLSLLAGGAGVILALTAVESLRTAMRSVLLIYFLGTMAFCAWHFGRVRSERAQRPKAWNWSRRETIGTLVGAGLVVLYVVTIRSVIGQREGWDHVAWRDHIAGPVLFFVGVAVTSVSITSPVRRSWLGWGLPAAFGGLVIPWCQTVAQTRMVLGVALVIGGLASAAILHRQLREDEGEHVAD